MKKTAFVLVTILIIAIVSACAERPTYESERGNEPARTGEYVEVSCACCDGHVLPIYETRVWDTDYVERYEDTINVMFDYDWTLLSTEEIYEEWCRERIEEYLLCHLAYRERVRSHDFIQWTIEYRDGNGNIGHVVLNNRYRFHFQVQSHVRENAFAYISEYYLENFVNTYIGEASRASQARVSVRFASVNMYTIDVRERFDELRNKVDEYQALLRTPDGAIRLSELTPANAFSVTPLKISISISLDGYLGADSYSFEEYIMSKAENMMESINYFTNDTFRGSITINFYRAEGGNPRRWLNYVQGERIHVDHQGRLGWYIVESYIGIFW